MKEANKSYNPLFYNTLTKPAVCSRNRWSLLNYICMYNYCYNKLYFKEQVKKLTCKFEWTTVWVNYNIELH